jgi:hypothetical protein
MKYEIHVTEIYPVYVVNRIEDYHSNMSVSIPKDVYEKYCNAMDEFYKVQSKIEDIYLNLTKDNYKKYLDSKEFQTKNLIQIYEEKDESSICGKCQKSHKYSIYKGATFTGCEKCTATDSTVTIPPVWPNLLEDSCTLR